MELISSEKLIYLNNILTDAFKKILSKTKDNNLINIINNYDIASSDNENKEVCLNSFQFKCAFIYLFGIKPTKKDVIRMFKSVNVENCIIISILCFNYRSYKSRKIY